MRYLKYFESEEFNDGGYKQIPMEEFDEKCDGIDEHDFRSEPEYIRKHTSETWEDYTNKEIRVINNLMMNHSDDYRYDLDTDNSGNPDSPYARITLSGVPYDEADDMVNYTIVKLKDSWFYVYDMYEDEFFKCDGLRGLKNCLVNILK